jgi:hypothetical protein
MNDTADSRWWKSGSLWSIAAVLVLLTIGFVALEEYARHEVLDYHSRVNADVYLVAVHFDTKHFIVFEFAIHVHSGFSNSHLEMIRSRSYWGYWPSAKRVGPNYVDWRVTWEQARKW